MRSFKNRRGIKVLALSFVSVSALVTSIAACGDDEARTCRVGADCASGACGADGQCVAVDPNPPGGDGGADVAPGTDGSVAVDAARDSSLPGCNANKDGIITRDEVPIAAGLYATYRVGKNENVSTAGNPAAGNRRTWDFSTMLASDVSVRIETQALTGKWFAATYAGATYATKLSEASDLLGVFETSPGALLLRGVVSPSESATATKLSYTPSVSVLKFPLALNATWTTDSDASGTAMGVDVAFAPTNEVYDSKVDAAGELKTPLGTFEVLRVATVLTRKVGVGFPTTTVIRSFAFVTECYGTVATVVSANNEPNAEFTSAAEIRRIAP